MLKFVKGKSEACDMCGVVFQELEALLCRTPVIWIIVFGVCSGVPLVEMPMSFLKAVVRRMGIIRISVTQAPKIRTP